MMGWLGRTILGNQVYFSSPASFNDPFDSKVWPSFDATTEEKRAYMERLLISKYGSLERYESRKELEGALTDPEFFEKGYRYVQTHDIPTLGVFYLSEISDDILMWSHYADGHRGVCLILAGSMLFPDLSVEPVSYPDSNQYPDVNFFKDSFDKQSDAVFLTKAKHWNYGREWRVIDTVRSAWHDIRPEWLLGLIIGFSTPEDQISLIRGLASKRGTPIKLFRAKGKRREFAVTIESF